MSTQKIAKATLDNNVRKIFMDKVSSLFKGDEILKVATNEIVIPTLDELGNETYISIKFSIPKGSKELGYNPYELVKEYENHIAEQDAKKKAQAEIKARKIAKAQAEKEARAKAKAEAKAEKENVKA